MRTLYIILLYVLSLVLETTVFGKLSVFGAKPDLVLIVIVLVALHRGPLPGEIYGFIGGLLEDFVTFGSLGIQALVKTLTGFGVGFLRNKIEEENELLLMLLVFFMAIISGFAASLAKTFFSSYVFLSKDALRIVLSALYTMVLTPPVMVLVKKIFAERK